ncbi:hypothetical protein CC79DRAFT_1329022 [Sarocladium strictum]
MTLTDLRLGFLYFTSLASFVRGQKWQGDAVDGSFSHADLSQKLTAFCVDFNMSRADQQRGGRAGHSCAQKSAIEAQR